MSGQAKVPKAAGGLVEGGVVLIKQCAELAKGCAELAKSFALLASLLKRAVVAAMDHDALNVAQSTAYSAMVALFPALIVAAAMVSLIPDTLPLRYQLAAFFERVLPSNVSPVLEAYFSGADRNPQTAKALVGSALVSLVGAAGVMATLMEGFRRAHKLPLGRRTFWMRRRRAMVLVPLSLVPMTAATALVMFGHVFTRWLVEGMDRGLRTTVYLMASGVRWTIALAGSMGILAVIYHMGTDLKVPVRHHLEPLIRDPHKMLRSDWSWRASLPGAALATLLWFVTTLGFGLYVTRFANYSQVYGQLGAAIALMVWLYLVALCVLVGSEFNAQVATHRRAGRAKERPDGVE